MDKKYFKYMTREEWHLRKSAVEYALKDNKIDTAVKLIVNMGRKHEILFKYYRPRLHSVETIKKSEIYMCRPSGYDDNGDCAYISDIKSLSKYFVEVYKRDEYKPLLPLMTDEFHNTIQQKVESHPDFKAFSKKFRDEALTACISENYSEQMWDDYAEHSTGFCAVFDTNELIVRSHELGFFFCPVRYVECRSNCMDICFSSEDYRNDDDSFKSYTRKHHLSCLTKDMLPYSKEGEWRLIRFNPGISRDEKGKTYPFIMPRVIITGKNMDSSSDVYKSLIELSNNKGIKIISSDDVTF